VKRISFAILFSALILTLGACEKPKTNFETGLEQQILHVANGEEPRELDPQLSTGSPESNIHLAIYEGLVNKHPKSLKVIPGVAKEWVVSEDGLKYTFYLRKNASWSNGDAITAQDFVWSWKRSLMPNLASEWAYMKFYIKNAERFYNGETADFSEVGVKAVDEHTLEVELTHRTDFFLQILDHPSYYPVHKATILAHGKIDQAISKWTLPENWVGNGPFSLTKWAINEEIAVEKNAHYWDAENVRLNGIHF
jgi:oligopeptide transport system substrate-binding protein